MVDWNSQKLLITGEIGFTGSTLAGRLVDQGATVTILDLVRRTEKSHSILHIRDKVQGIESDSRDSETGERAVEDNDVVSHLASKTSGISG